MRMNPQGFHRTSSKWKFFEPSNFFWEGVKSTTTWFVRSCFSSPRSTTPLPGCSCNPSSSIHPSTPTTTGTLNTTWGKRRETLNYRLRGGYTCLLPPRSRATMKITGNCLRRRSINGFPWWVVFESPWRMWCSCGWWLIIHLPKLYGFPWKRYFSFYIC